MSQLIVLITGANSGIGFATAKVIAGSSPCYHVILACRSLVKADAAVGQLMQGGISAAQLSTVHLDVLDEESIEAAVAEVDRRFGRLDVLINNAGINNTSPDIKTRLQACFETNVLGPALVAGAFRPLQLRSKKAYVIYVTSVMGSLHRASDPASPNYATPGRPYLDAYRACKAALNMWMIRDHVDNQDVIKVFGVCPGLVRSNLIGSAEAIKLGAKAAEPEVPGATILNIIEGNRDAEVGRVVTKDGVNPW